MAAKSSAGINLGVEVDERTVDSANRSVNRLLEQSEKSLKIAQQGYEVARRTELLQKGADPKAVARLAMAEKELAVTKLRNKAAADNARLEAMGLRGDLVGFRNVFGRGSALGMAAQAARGAGPFLAIGFAISEIERLGKKALEVGHAFGESAGGFDKFGIALATFIPGLGTYMDRLMGAGKQAQDVIDANLGLQGKIAGFRRVGASAGLVGTPAHMHAISEERRAQMETSRKLREETNKFYDEGRQKILDSSSSDDDVDAYNERFSRIGLSMPSTNDRKMRLDKLEGARRNALKTIADSSERQNEIAAARLANPELDRLLGGNPEGQSTAISDKYRSSHGKLNDAVKQAAFLQRFYGLDSDAASKFVAQNINEFGVNRGVSPLITAGSQGEHQLYLNDRDQTMKMEALNVARRILAVLEQQGKNNPKDLAIQGNMF